MPEKKGKVGEFMANHQSTQACTERQHIITEQDLPLSCPSRGMQLWDAHPRVYLPIEKKGKIACPYCGTLYVLKKDNPDHPSIETWYQEGGGK